MKKASRSSRTVGRLVIAFMLLGCLGCIQNVGEPDSCPADQLEDAIRRVLESRGVSEVKGVGIFTHDNEIAALRIAENLALVDAVRRAVPILVKVLSRVLQTEETTRLTGVVETHVNARVDSYERMFREYDRETRRAEVHVRISTDDLVSIGADAGKQF